MIQSMPDYELLNCFPRFESLWPRIAHLPVPAQIEAWHRLYIEHWPELLELQITCHAEEQLDWRQVASERIFPRFPAALNAMRQASAILQEILPGIYRKTCVALSLDLPVVFVIYAGLGCGAGWAAGYGGKPAVLFGLENIAAEGWVDQLTLTGMTAHELGHLAYFAWLEQAGLAQGVGDWWTLFEEGFAQRCEHVILGKETWHMAHGAGVTGWLEWCQANRGWLAGEYLRCMEEGLPVRQFFGSWFDIQGYKQTGYYLGHEVVRSLEVDLSLREIACLPQLETLVRAALNRLKNDSGE